MSTHDTSAKLDQATARRLARLRSMPVDTTRLEAALRTKLPPQSASSARPVVLTGIRAQVAWLGPVRAAAASLLIVATLAAVLLVSSAGPALAAPADMAEVHQKLISGEVPITRINSVDEAGEVLRSQWAGVPALPDLPDEHVAACCLKSIKNRKVACLLLNGHSEPVSVVVGKADDFRLPDGSRQTVNGVEYRVGSSGEVNMVMTEHAGRLVCVMGRVEMERLIDLAAELRF